MFIFFRQTKESLGGTIDNIDYLSYEIMSIVISLVSVTMMYNVDDGKGCPDAPIKRGDAHLSFYSHARKNKAVLKFEPGGALSFGYHIKNNSKKFLKCFLNDLCNIYSSETNFRTIEEHLYVIMKKKMRMCSRKVTINVLQPNKDSTGVK